MRVGTTDTSSSSVRAALETRARTAPRTVGGTWEDALANTSVTKNGFRL
jgi:hypothetical protein